MLRHILSRTSSIRNSKRLPPVRVLEAAFTRADRAGITKGEPWRRFPSPGVAAFISFAAQAKPVRFESTGASALHTLPYGFNPGDATGTQGIGV